MLFLRIQRFPFVFGDSVPKKRVQFEVCVVIVRITSSFAYFCVMQVIKIMYVREIGYEMSRQYFLYIRVPRMPRIRIKRCDDLYAGLNINGIAVEGRRYSERNLEDRSGAGRNNSLFYPRINSQELFAVKWHPILRFG